MRISSRSNSVRGANIRSPLTRGAVRRAEVGDAPRRADVLEHGVDPRDRRIVGDRRRSLSGLLPIESRPARLVEHDQIVARRPEALQRRHVPLRRHRSHAYPRIRAAGRAAQLSVRTDRACPRGQRGRPSAPLAGPTQPPARCVGVIMYTRPLTGQAVGQLAGADVVGRRRRGRRPGVSTLRRRRVAVAVDDAGSASAWRPSCSSSALVAVGGRRRGRRGRPAATPPTPWPTMPPRCS